MSNGIGRVWAVNANGGDEGRPNGVGPVYIENIDKIGGGVPDPSGASTGDVLTVDDQGNPAWEPPTGGGGGSYTAGDGIAIENDEISVNYDEATLGLKQVTTTVSVSETTQVGPNNNISSISIAQTGVDTALTSDTGVSSITLHIPGGTFFSSSQLYPNLYLCTGDPYQSESQWLWCPVTLQNAVWDVSQHLYVIPEQDVVIQAPASGVWDSEPVSMATAFAFAYAGYGTRFSQADIASSAFSRLTPNPALNRPVTFTYAVSGPLTVTNPLPAHSSGDSGKVLTVDAQGALAWGMLGSVKSIQQVSALPATPDANTLYLIPEA
jgi:hypothetical protein